MRALRVAAPLLLVSAATTWAAPRIAAAPARPGGDLSALVDAGRWSVRDAGRTTPLSLPPGTRIDAVAALDDGWLAAGSREQDGAGDLYVVRSVGGRTVDVAAPRARSGQTAASPVLFSGRSGIDGMAWVEGPRPERFAVRFARWNGSAFEEPETVAPAGPGSQLALAATVLGDGRLLLVWAGFDGEDDEIWASVRDARGWSSPRRVVADNDVPDITPAVVATTGGALVSWSELDGWEYRLAGARFDGGTFHDLGFLAPPGSLYPSYEGAASQPLLLYLDARAGEWVAAEVAGDGRLGRAARIAGDDDDRPLVRAEPGGVRWSFGDRTSASAWR